MRVKQITLTISIPEHITDFNSLEDWLFDRLKGIGGDIIRYWCGEIERKLLKYRSKGIRKEREKSIYLHTRFGDVPISRWKVSKKNKETAGRNYFYPLDRYIGIEKKQVVAKGLKQKTIELTSDNPYHKTSRLLEQQGTSKVSPMRAWKWVQECGRDIRQKEKQAVRYALRPTAEELKPKQPKEVIAVEADATYISSNEGKGKHHDVKLGVIYTSKKDCGKNGKRRRLILQEKIAVATLEDRPTFGDLLWYKAQGYYGADKAAYVLYMADGDRWLKDIQQYHFPSARYALDLWHLQENISKTIGMDKDPYKLFKHIYSNKIGILIKKLDILKKQQRKAEKRQQYQDLMQYIETNREGILSFRKLRHIKELRKRKLLTSGSGAIEKNVEIFIGRRFKKQGMHWSRQGADNLLIIRTLIRCEPDTWDKIWQRK